MIYIILEGQPMGRVYGNLRNGGSSIYESFSLHNTQCLFVNYEVLFLVDSDKQHRHWLIKFALINRACSAPPDEGRI
jgi:hypothetical protein